jgi:hypothetical protein
LAGAESGHAVSVAPPAPRCHLLRQPDIVLISEREKIVSLGAGQPQQPQEAFGAARPVPILQHHAASRVACGDEVAHHLDRPVGRAIIPPVQHPVVMRLAEQAVQLRRKEMRAVEGR